MDKMVVDAAFWAGKKVFLTGHTGFKGGWLALWLGEMGAKVDGYALPPAGERSLFDDADILAGLAHHAEADIRGAQSLAIALSESAPDVVFHLAAQALVSEGYRDPVGTYVTNVIGTANLLTAAFAVPSVKAIVSVASDKCYENREWVHPYRETDRLGGADPYSSSKGCAEIMTESFRISLRPDARVASVRAGNVIGGGDWAENRLVPDCIRAFSIGNPVELRQPLSVRPWQFVLDPLAGYLILAQKLAESKDRDLEGGWNFGPAPGTEATALEVARRLARHWGPDAKIVEKPETAAFSEAGILRLDSTKARVALGWSPRLNAEASIDWTAEWYSGWRLGTDLRKLMRHQIGTFMEIQ